MDLGQSRPCSYYFHGYSENLCTFRKKYIICPEDDAFRKTVQDFNVLRSNKSFPNVVGCVDGTHIPIPSPKGNDSFYNRKGYYVLLLQIKLNFTTIFLCLVYPFYVYLRLKINFFVLVHLKRENNYFLQL